jgi:hypothetical protein
MGPLFIMEFKWVQTTKYKAGGAGPCALSLWSKPTKLTMIHNCKTTGFFCVCKMSIRNMLKEAKPEMTGCPSRWTD